MDTSSDYISGWHLRDNVERQHFARQALLYLSRLNARIADLAERATTEEIPPHALIGAYEEVHLAFRMRFWAYESIADMVRLRSVSMAGGLGLARASLKVALALFAKQHGPALKRLRDARREFSKLLPQCDHQILVAYDAEPPDLSIHDTYAWVRRCYDPQRGPMIGALWPVIEAAANPDTEAIPTVPTGSNPTPVMPSIRLTRSQDDCAEKLRFYWLAQTGGKIAAGYGLRPPLIAAQSGSGKTRLIRWFADSARLPLVTLDAGSWQLTGSRADQPTLAMLQEFHQQNERGIVFLDELDKATGRDGGWWMGVNLEIMSYLDGRLHWPAELLTKKHTKFLVIGAGTWQSVFRSGKRNLGFGTCQAEEDAAHAIEAGFGGDQQSIPEELGFRFDSPIILYPPDAEEFAERITLIRKEAGFSPANPPALAALVEEATSSGRGQRWLEHYASRMLRERLLADERYDSLHF